MVADDLTSKGTVSVEEAVPGQTASSTNDDDGGEQSQPAGGAAETAESAERTSSPAAAADEPEVPSPRSESSPSQKPRRRVQLKPTVDPSQLRAFPTHTPTPSVSVQPPVEKTEVSGIKSSNVPVASSRAVAVSSISPPPEVAPVDAEAESESTLAGTSAAASSAPAMVQPPSRKPVEIPPERELDAELEAEIAAAMGQDLQAPLVDPAGVAEPEVTPPAEEELEEALEEGKRLKGTVQAVHGDNVFLDLGYRSPGIVQLRQFESATPPQPGKTLKVVVSKVDAEEGLIICTLPHGKHRVRGNWDEVAQGQVVDCMVNKTNKGGLDVTVGSLRGFLPSSQVDVHFVSDLEPYVGQKLRVKIIEANPQKRNLVVSRRACIELERAAAEEQLWTTLAVGQQYAGVVKTIKDYGAFVDIGGVDGFLHIGEISWNRIRHPSDVLREGQQVDVQIVSLDPEKKRIGLGMRQLVQNPWANIADRYHKGQNVGGKVTRTADFGAFVELETGVEGLVHISELDYKHVNKVTDLLTVGQEIDAQVLEVDPERKRISLSLKALKPKPEAPGKPARPADEDLAPSGGEQYARKRKAPLKGGTGGKTNGGGLFGNPRDFG